MLAAQTKGMTARSRLNEYLTSEVKRWTGSDLPPSLYHYTSGAGINAIASGKVLRAYNLGQVNDFVEGRFAASIMRANIDRSYALEADTAALALFASMRRQLVNVELSQVFVLSFTTNGDEPGMWRLYADRGRGFSFSIRLHTALTWAAEAHDGIILKCNYGEAALQDFCAASLVKVREIFLSDSQVGLDPNPDEYAQMFLENSAWLAPAFKPEIWKDEREWRFLFVRPREAHKKQEDGRTFIELPLIPEGLAKQSPISAICCGPLGDYEDDILPLQKTLFDHGYGADFPIHIATSHVVRPGRKPPVFGKRA